VWEEGGGAGWCSETNQYTAKEPNLSFCGGRGMEADSRER